MRKIDLNRKDSYRRLTCMCYGPSRAGKTRFGGSFPRPLFLSDASEGGWETLIHMDPEALYEPDRKPEVFALEQASDMIQALSEVRNRIASKPGEILTVVVDSLTFYADTYFAALEKAAYDRAGSSGRRPDSRQLYMDLGQHLRWLALQVHQLPVNVVWICLEKPPSEDNPNGSILIPGSNADKFPARCDYLMYHRAYQVSPAAGITYEIRTRRYGAFNAGGRDEGRLPDPLPECSYRALAEAVGIGAPPLSKPVVVAKPAGPVQTRTATVSRQG